MTPGGVSSTIEEMRSPAIRLNNVDLPTRSDVTMAIVGCANLIPLFLITVLNF